MKKVLLLVFAVLSISCAQKGERVSLTPKTVVVFADSALAASVVTSEDDYTRLISAYEKSAGMKTDKPVSYKDYMTHLAKNVRKWKKGEIEKFTGICEKAGLALNGLNLNLPQEIILIKTTSQEFGGVTVAYTRQNAVMFTEPILSSPKLYNIFLHEIFHIYTTLNPEIKEKLYAIIGFRQVNEIRMPEELNERRITNPDAPALNTIIDLEIEGEVKTLTPLLYAKNPVYDTTKPGGIFQSMSFQMMAVEEKDGKWQPVFMDGNPVLYDPHDLKEYFNKVGRNTSYIIHPEEIMASNFDLLVTGAKDLPNPEIIDAFREVLKNGN